MCSLQFLRFKITGFLFFLLLILAQTEQIYSQSSANYTFSTNTAGSLIQTSSGSAIDLSGQSNLISNDFSSVNAANLPIGFDFYFMGTRYDTLTVGADGQVGLGKRFLSGSTDNNLVLPLGQPPILAPFWDDLRTAKSGQTVRMITVGSAPNRCCVIEWYALINSASTTAVYDGVFQLRLYETTGVIEFVYGKMYVGTTYSNVTASIGFTAGTTDNSMISVTDLSTLSVTTVAAAVVNNLVNHHTAGPITTLNSEVEGSRRTLVFTPLSGTVSAPTNLTFPTVYGTSIQLQWNDNSTTESFFKIYRSTDNINFTYIASVNSTTSGGTGTAYSYSAVGLTENTTYYWRISAANEASPESGLLAGTQATSASSLLSGKKTVGPSGDYASLTDAITDMQVKGLAGNFELELLAAYNSSVETFPLIFTSINTSVSKTLTIYPHTDAVGLVISSDNYNKTIELFKQNYVTFDGRPGKSGSSKQLTISNTNLNGIAFRFYYNSSFNTLRYCNFTGVNNTASAGVISFNQPEGNQGTNNNTIEYCDIHAGASTPNNAIYCYGLPASSTATKNIIIQYCNIYDFYSDGGTSRGIYLTNGTASWTIKNNSFYQTSPRYPTMSSTVMNAIEIFDWEAYNHKIYENFIGGSAPHLGGDSLFIFASTNRLIQFRGIYIYTASNSLNSIQGNRISRLRFETYSNSFLTNLFRGIETSYGIYSIGDTTANIIGGISGNDSLIIMINGYRACNIRFIDLNDSQGGFINNNIIGAIRFYINNSQLTSVYGIYSGSGLSASRPQTIYNNQIGNLTTPNSLNINVTASPVDLIGIFAQSYGAGNLTIQNNTIANLSHKTSSSLSSSRVCGIQVLPHSSSTNYILDLTISNNTICKLSSTGQGGGTGTSASLIGILNKYQPTSSLTINKNTIYGLQNTNTSLAVWVTGISNADTTSLTGNIQKNFIHHISSSLTTTSAYVAGIYHEGKNTSYANNMIQLGFHPDGSVITNDYNLIGIYDNGKQANICFNTIYIGGSGVVAGSSLSACIKRATNTNTDNYRNNILQNNRASGSKTINHYCVDYHSVTNLTSDYNIYYPSGAGSYLGYIATVNYQSLSPYQSALGLDLHSGLGNPNLVLPGGTVTTVDLHVASPTAIEASGENISGITDDFDDQTRSSLTPVDIGADAGNFTLTDVINPQVSFTPLGNGNSNNRVLNNFTTITDNAAIAGGGNAPRLYYKKSTDNNIFGDNNSSANGWKYVSGTASGSVYSFTIDYSLIFGGSVSEGNTINYFVAAQDLTGNLASLPLGATGSVTSISAAPSTPYSYNIVPSISGTLTVGSGGTYSGLTTAGGIFETLNNRTLTGNIDIKILSDLTSETGDIALNQLSEAGSGGEYSVTISPNDASAKLISGNSSIALIKINGTDRLTIDGSFGGSGNYFTFSNSNTNASLIKIYNDASYVNIKFCNLNSATQDTNLATIYIDEGTTTGNHDIDIDDNLFGDVEVVVDKDGTKTTEVIYVPANGIYIESGNVPQKMTHRIRMRRNRHRRFRHRGIYSRSGGREFTISDNHFYRSSPITENNTVAIISLEGGENSYGHTITGNKLGGSDQNCAGSPFVVGGDVGFSGIYVSSGTTAVTTIDNNTIQNIIQSNNSTSKPFTGIKTEGGKVNIGTPGNGNRIGSFTNSALAMQTEGTGTTTGIMTSSREVQVVNNYVSLWQNSENRGVVTGINVDGANAVTATGNFIANLGPMNGGVALSSTSGVVGLTCLSPASGSPAYYVINNTISLGKPNGSNANYVGLLTSIQNGTFVLANNSVHLEGTTHASNSSGSSCIKNSYGDGTFNLSSINNILYNGRTGGTGGHYAFSNNQSPTRATVVQNNNLYVSPDAQKFAKDGSVDYSFSSWKSGSWANYMGLDRFSMFSTSGGLAPGSLWYDPAGLDYGPNTNSPYSWVLNGQGQPTSYVPKDINGHNRSTSVLTGATDIGTNEFQLTVDPPDIPGSPSPTPGGITLFNWYNKLVADVTWGTDGTLPVTAALMDYAGTNPPNATSGNPNAQYRNEYSLVKLYGGSGYTFALRQYLDPSKQGKITNAYNQKLASWTGSEWGVYTSTAFNPSYGYLRTNYIHGPSSEANATYLFAVTSSDNPLPVELSLFSAVAHERDAELRWTTITEFNSGYFEIERHNSAGVWVPVARMNAAGMSNSIKEYSYWDKRLNTGKFTYRLKCLDNNGEFSYSDLVEVEIDKPATFALMQNYPNPFNPETKIEFNLPAKALIRLELYNITGELIYIIRDNIFEPGFHSVLLNTNNVSRGLATGVYFYRMIALDENRKLVFMSVKKLLYLK
ncbi:MAG TPA: hypothetical protein PKY46_01480 [Ignavibacteriaceae bacterium]|nr:hypothetical protein [Ignavibacteriaceae bacterium]